MNLATIISQARSGELRGLSPKDKTDEVIINYINLALIVLYGRFNLRVDEAILSLQEGKSLYKLDGTDNTVTVSGQSMVDGSVLSITDAFDERGPIGINDGTDPYSIFVPSYETIQVPNPKNDSYISILYKASPDLVTFVDNGEGNAVDVPVKLPLQLLEALLHYVGYRAHGSVDGNIEAENNTHLMRFEQACKKVEDLALVPTDSINMENVRKGFIL